MATENGTQMAFDAIAGAVAGAAAVWVLDRVDWFNYNHESPSTRSRTQEVRPGGLDPAHVLAQKVSRAVGSELEPAQPNMLGLGIHYGIGIGPGAIYSVLVDRYPMIGAGRGTLFGLGLFLAQDEVLNSVMGLSGRPSRYPWQDHARGLVAHLAYGLALDTGVRVLKGAMRAPTGHYEVSEDEMRYAPPEMVQKGAEYPVQRVDH